MEIYSEDFYDGRQAGARQSARAIVPVVLELVQPDSVVDVGCGDGTWLRVLAEHGVGDILGVEGDWVRPEALQIPRDRFLARDLRKPLDVSREFDLVVSLEVAEHLPRECAETFVGSLVSLGPVVLFSAAIPFQGGRNHVNEQWPEYWAALFRTRGYVALDCIREKIWEEDSVEWWYAQNAFLFVRESHLETHQRLRREREQSHRAPLALVHPRHYVEKSTQIAALADPRNLPFRTVLKALPGLARNTFLRRIRRIRNDRSGPKNA